MSALPSVEYDPLCAHCRRRVNSRPRGLCFACYYDPAIRGQHQWLATPTNQRHGIPDYYGPDRPAPDPTDALPGSAEKVAVFEARAAAGFALFHPNDTQR